MLTFFVNIPYTNNILARFRGNVAPNALVTRVDISLYWRL